MADSVLLGDSSDQRGFTVGDMANGADVDSCLPRDDLWVERRDFVDVEIVQCLRGEVSLCEHGLLLLVDDVFASLSSEFEFAFRFFCVDWLFFLVVLECLVLLLRFFVV